MIAADGTTTAYRFDNARHDRVVTGEVGARGRFTIGGVTNNVVASVASYQARSENAYALSNFAGFADNLYRPVDVAEPTANFFTGGQLGSPKVTDRTRTSSAAVADMIGLFDRRLLLTGGLRYQRIEDVGYDYDSGAQTGSYVKGRVTPVGGVVFRLDPRVSLYANYIEGLVKGDTAPAVSGSQVVVNGGEVFQPYRTTQEEVGVKVDLGTVGGAFGVYQSRKPLASVDTGGRFGITDHQRNRGVELSVFGEPGRGVRLLGGATFLDSDVSGKDAIGSPKAQVNLGAEWNVPGVEGLWLDGRAIHTSTQYADAANTQRVPSWTRFDLGARYRMDVAGHDVTFRARVENVANRNQWVSVGGYPGAGYLVLGAPRTFIGSATFAY